MFFASIVMNLKKVKTKSIPTAGVTVKDYSFVLYWNPNFVAKLSKKKFFGLLKHECYHLIYQHVVSRKQDPHDLWNIATDLAINSLIDESYLPEGGLIPGNAFDESLFDNLPPEIAERNKKMSNVIASLPKRKSSEWYMDTLKQDPEISAAFKDACQNGFGQGEGRENGPGFDVHLDGDGTMKDSDIEIMKGKLRDILKKSADKANSRPGGWGSCSTGTKDYIANSFNSRVNCLAIYIDQSGSVGDEAIALFFGALESLAKNVSFKVFHFDTSIDKASEYAWKKGQKYNLPMRTLTGGTCFNCVEDHFRKRICEFDGYWRINENYTHSRCTLERSFETRRVYYCF